MEWRRYGPEAVLIRVGEAPDDAAARIRAALENLRSDPPPDVVDVTPAFEKLLVEFAAGADVPRRADELVARFGALEPLPPEAAPLLEIPVVYDGPDLGELAETKGLTADEVIDLHTEATYTVGMIGFSPGFPYLSGLDARLHTQRRASPRALVPAGSVAIGGPHTGIYSSASAGGWHLIGRTEVRVFDARRGGGDEEKMFLLRPGERVRFVAVEDFNGA